MKNTSEMDPCDRLYTHNQHHVSQLNRIPAIRIVHKRLLWLQNKLNQHFYVSKSTCAYANSYGF